MRRFWKIGCRCERDARSLTWIHDNGVVGLAPLDTNASSLVDYGVLCNPIPTPTSANSWPHKRLHVPTRRHIGSPPHPVAFASMGGKMMPLTTE
jgi:hypothetical protein